MKALSNTQRKLPIKIYSAVLCRTEPDVAFQKITEKNPTVYLLFIDIYHILGWKVYFHVLVHHSDIQRNEVALLFKRKHFKKR